MIARVVTHSLLLILKALLELDREAYGLEICKQADVLRATGYPILGRLCGTGVLTARWSTAAPGPPRKYYTLRRERRAEVVELLTRRGIELPEVAF